MVSPGIGMPTSLADFNPMTTQPRMLVSPTGRREHSARPSRRGLERWTKNATARSAGPRKRSSPVRA